MFRVILFILTSPVLIKVRIFGLLFQCFERLKRFLFRYLLLLLVGRQSIHLQCLLISLIGSDLVVLYEKLRVNLLLSIPGLQTPERVWAGPRPIGKCSRKASSCNHQASARSLPRSHSRPPGYLADQWFVSSVWIFPRGCIVWIHYTVWKKEKWGYWPVAKSGK